MSKKEPEIELVMIKEKTVFLDDGQILQITNFINAEGEDNEGDPEGALSCVAGPDRNGKWWSIDLTELEKVIFN